MNITLKPETLKRINERIRRGDFDSEQAIVEQAVAFFLDYEEEAMDEKEFRHAKGAIDEALEQAQHGEAISLDEFDKDMRAKYGIQR